MIEILTGIISRNCKWNRNGRRNNFNSFFMEIEQHIAQATNIVFFIPTSIIAIIVNLKQKLINVRTSIVLIIAGIIGAIVGATLAQKLDAVSLKKYFGMFLAIIALYEIYTIIKQYILKRKKT